MLPLERYQKIVGRVEAQGVVTVHELVLEFQVSDMTIRRDLKMLEDEGRLLRTHGGAVSVGEAVKDPLAARSKEGATQKALLGQAAAEFVTSGATIYLGTGSTIAAMVPFLHDKRPLTIVSPSLAVFNQLADWDQVTFILVGGFWLNDTGCFVGESSEVQIAQYRFQTAFVSASGVHPEAGVYIGVPAIASLEKAALEASDTIILLAQSGKIGRSALVRVCDLSSVDTLITDVPSDSGLLAICRQKTQVILANSTTSSAPHQVP